MHIDRDVGLTGSESILLVDDEMAIIKMAKNKLGRLGYQVQGLTDPVAALKLVQTEPEAFDLVIVDMVMPEMNGAQLAEALLKERPELPVILCSGYSAISTEEALKIGFCQCLQKPIDLNLLAGSVRKALDGN